MSWSRTLNLHVDVDAPASRSLITSGTDSSVLTTPPELIAGDKLTVRISFWQRGTTPGSVTLADPGGTSTFRLSGRPQNVPADSALLFLASSFTQISAGVWETILDLATAELAAYLALAPAGTKTIQAEIEVRDASDTVRRSIQFAATVRPQVYDNQDAPTALPSPAEWLLGSTAPINAVAASGVLSLAALAIGDTATIGGVTYTFVVSAGAANDVYVGETLAGGIANLVSAINVGAGGDVGFGTVPNPLVSAVDNLDDSITLTAITPGAGGNAISVHVVGAEEIGPFPLAGGINATAAPPYLRTHGGFLHIQEAGIWKKVALAPL